MDTQKTTVNSVKKKNPLKTNLVLAGLLVVLGSFAYWFEFKHRPKKAEVEAKSSKLFVIDENKEVESLKISHGGKQLEFLCKQNCKVTDSRADWQILQPIQFKADEGNIESFITSVASSFVTETIDIDSTKDVESSLSAFGLSSKTKDKEKVEIKLAGEAQPIIVYVGDKAAVGENTYLMTDEKVKLASAGFKNVLERDLNYWRSKRLFHIGASEITALELTNKYGKISLIRENGNWFIKEGAKTEAADNEIVDTFLTGLVFMNASKYVSDNKSKDRTKFRIPSKPKFFVSFVTGEKKNSTEHDIAIFETFLDKQPKLFATVKGQDYIVELDRGGIDRFSKRAEDFKFRNLLTREQKEKIQALDLTIGKEKLSFSKQANQWKITSGKLENFEPEKVEDSIKRVFTARRGDVVKTVPKGTKPISDWKFFDENKKLIKSISIYVKDDRGDFYLKKLDGGFFKLDRTSTLPIPMTIGFFQKGFIEQTIAEPGQPAPSHVGHGGHLDHAH
ncbi:MAG: DUF4340 domain-containing protein [Bacteriovoracia bacterium]